MGQNLKPDTAEARKRAANLRADGFTTTADVLCALADEVDEHEEVEALIEAYGEERE